MKGGTLIKHTPTRTPAQVNWTQSVVMVIDSVAACLAWVPICLEQTLTICLMAHTLEISDI